MEQIDTNLSPTPERLMSPHRIHKLCALMVHIEEAKHQLYIAIDSYNRCIFVSSKELIVVLCSFS